mmetsp:Transcript_5862/g.12913  ORF Transcript_5862/g.12913 Transcript_5862/m.12913 type:complete len:107 (-) Transcript_5862:375-695(-)
MGADFQAYLRNWAATVAHEQRLCCDQMETVEGRARVLFEKTGENVSAWKKKSRAVAIDHKEIYDLSREIKDAMAKVKQSLVELNDSLPEEERLPPLWQLEEAEGSP